MIGVQRVTGKLLAIFQCPFGIAVFNRSFLVWLLFGDFLRFLLCQRKGGRVPILGNFPLCLEREGIGVIIDWLGLQLLVVVARVPNTIAVEIAEQTEVVGAWGDEIEVGMSILNLEALDGFIAQAKPEDSLAAVGLDSRSVLSDIENAVKNDRERRTVINAT